MQLFGNLLELCSFTNIISSLSSYDHAKLLYNYYIVVVFDSTFCSNVNKTKKCFDPKDLNSLLNRDNWSACNFLATKMLLRST